MVEMVEAAVVKWSGCVQENSRTESSANELSNELSNELDGMNLMKYQFLKLRGQDYFILNNFGGTLMGHVRQFAY